MSHRLVAYVFLFSFFAAAGAFAAPQLRTETIVERDLRQIAERLRCPVCQSENLYDSKAPIAREMRAIIREKLSEGRSDTQIISFFVARYGTFVLQEPPKTGSQLFLWFGPFLIAFVASLALARHLRRSDHDQQQDGDDALVQDTERQST